MTIESGKLKIRYITSCEFRIAEAALPVWQLWNSLDPPSIDDDVSDTITRLRLNTRPVHVMEGRSSKPITNNAKSHSVTTYWVCGGWASYRLIQQKKPSKALIAIYPKLAESDLYQLAMSETLLDLASACPLSGLPKLYTAINKLPAEILRAAFGSKQLSVARMAGMIGMDVRKLQHQIGKAYPPNRRVYRDQLTTLERVLRELDSQWGPTVRKD